MQAATLNVKERTHEGIFGLTEELSQKGSLVVGDESFKEKLDWVVEQIPKIDAPNGYEVQVTGETLTVFPLGANGLISNTGTSQLSIQEVEMMWRTSDTVTNAVIEMDKAKLERLNELEERLKR